MKKLTSASFRNLILAAFVVIAANFALASELKVKVKGMVCAFCVQGIEKTFKANPAVEKVSVSLKEKLMSLKLKEGQTLSRAEISELLKSAGYEADFDDPMSTVAEVKKEK